MAAQKKHKKMSVKEKTMRAECKKRLQAEGILPPDKPRLNRKKFAKEVCEEFDRECSNGEGAIRLHQSLGWIVHNNMRNVTSEEIGVLKLMKITIELKKFENEVRMSGETSYNLKDAYDRIKPILEL